MNKHDLYKREDADAPDVIKDRNGDVALGLCRRCGRVESELAEPCVNPQAVLMAKRFHETYERLAPSYGYETRRDTKVFDPGSANGRLMAAVCAELMAVHAPAVPSAAMLTAARDWSARRYGKPIGNDAATGCWQAMYAAIPVPGSPS